MNISAKITQWRQSLEESETIRSILSDEKKKKTIALLFAGVVLFSAAAFALSDSGESEAQSAEKLSEMAQSAEAEYESALEVRMAELLTAVDGVGQCKVMVTIEKGEYKMFAKDSYEDTSGNKNEYVILEDKSGGDSGLIVNVIAPEIKGVAVVCEGGDSAVVRSEVVSLVTSVLSINSTQVSVSKMK